CCCGRNRNRAAAGAFAGVRSRLLASRGFWWHYFPAAILSAVNPRMNVHHLELFYYVARYGGIMEAVRNMPYGIQQPASSAQVSQLEEFLGLTLFQRRPFALTPGGEKLY